MAEPKNPPVLTATVAAPWDNPGLPPTDAAQIAAAGEQAKAAAAAAASTVPPGPDAQAPQTPVAASGAAPAAEVADEIVVTVTAPKPFTLNVSHELRVQYKAGVQEMPLAHAEHWWAKANGVVIYKR